MDSISVWSQFTYAPAWCAYHPGSLPSSTAGDLWTNGHKLVTVTIGLIGKEGNLFRFTLFHSLTMTLVVCIITLLQACWFSWMLP